VTDEIGQDEVFGPALIRHGQAIIAVDHLLPNAHDLLHHLRNAFQQWETGVSDPTAALLVRIYRDWSEDRYCAGFIDPTPATVAEFIEALPDLLAKETVTPRETYEIEFLAEYARQTGRTPG